MAFYECTFVARGDLNKADLQKMTDTLVKIVTDAGDTVIKNEYWGLRTLAYKINKMGKGHYTMLGLEAKPATMRELERNISINEDVIRHLNIRVDAMDATPSVMLNQRSGDNYENNAA